MISVKERYERDPVFRALVQSFFHMYENHADGMTPSEIREAAGFAWQMYYERNAYPIIKV